MICQCALLNYSISVYSLRLAVFFAIAREKKNTEKTYVSGKLGDDLLHIRFLLTDHEYSTRSV